MHVACLPFPSAQGTQAAIAAMLDALRAGGREAPLLCYPHGDPRLTSRARVERLSMPALTRSLRSGPSFSKLALDAGMVAALRRAPRGELLVCHHVEAAWAARLAGRGYVYVAHTSLEDELATYFPRASAPAPRAALSRAGRALDAFALAGARRAAAVSPALGRRLAARHGRQVGYLPVPWALSEPAPREAARRALQLEEDALVVLYTGNLDGYQRWEDALDVVKSLRAEGAVARLLVATESCPEALHRRAASIALDAVIVRGLATEDDRRVVHAAADVAVVPRRSPGGVPIKLLDALARGVPVAATEAALAGLPLEGVVALGSGPRDLARACEIAAREREPRASRGRAFVRESHGPGAFLDAYARLVPAREPSSGTTHGAGARTSAP